MAKKKKPIDKKQKSLFSFVEKSKEIAKKPEKNDLKRKVGEKQEKFIEKAKKKELKPEIEKIEKTKIPQDVFFKGNDKSFGLKEGNIKLENISRESFSSKYIRYLIKKGDIVQNLERGLLLDVDYDGGENKAYCKFYDLNSDDIKIWIDTTGHTPYCLSKQSKAELENNIKLTNYGGFKELKEIKKFDLLKDKEISMTKIYGKTPTDIGGSGENIRNILEKAWEADIRYHLNYIYDTGIIPGLIYRIKNGNIEKIDYTEEEKGSEKVAEEFLNLFKNERPEIQKFAKKNLDIFLTKVPDVKRMAIDIEVNMGPNDLKIPDPRQAKQEIISISFVSTDGLKLVYVLKREGYIYGEKLKNFPSDAKIVFFESEKNLLTESFRLIWNYPIIITFNGDNFDLVYMFHRANKLKIDRDLNPIQVKRGFGFLSRAECNLRKGIHIDLFNFFFNRSIAGYAFGGAYEKSSLNSISYALLGEEKYQHEEEIHKMDYSVLTWYNLKDSILTLELTKFNNSLVWNLIVLICRMTKMPIHDMVRHQISAWIQNIFYFEHRQNNYLIPRRSEISELKKGGYSKSTIQGKGFKGAYVVPPTPGIHYNVVVMDFACFSSDTEIMTNKGWLSYSELKQEVNNGIKIATAKQKNLEIEFNPVKEIYEYNYNDIMVNIKQQGLDILVTPNHRIVYHKISKEGVKNAFNGEFSIKRADDLINDNIFAIPCFGEWEGKSKIIVIGNNEYNPKDFLPFLGWLLISGEINDKSVHIYHSNKKNFESIRESLNNIGYNYKENIREIGGKSHRIFSIHDKEFRDALENWFIKNFGKFKKRIPREILNLPKEELKLLYKTMLLGNGGQQVGKMYCFTTNNKDLANDFQELALKIGIGCNIKKVTLSAEIGGKGNKGVNYKCQISYERKYIIRKQDSSYISYNGIVWCVKVKNGTVIVRRKGKPFISGNSLYPTIIKEYNLSYETVLCPHDDCTDNLIKGIPYHVCTHKMGIFAYVVGFFRDIRVKFFKPKSSDRSLSEQRRSYYNTIQQALKVFINGSYGVFGSKNFPLFCLPVAESTTGIGRYSIKSTIEKSKKMGIQVLYGDSDSVFLLNPSKQQLEEISKWSKEKLDLDLEEEKTYQFLALSERKKNYLGIYKNTKNVDIKGLIAKKKNTPNFIKKIFAQMLDLLKNVTNDEEFKKTREEIIRIVKENLRKIGKPNAFSLEDYVINISLQKDLNKYKKVIPQHVNAALELKKATGKELQKGEVVSFIKSKGHSGAKALELAKFQDIDVKKYQELLKSALEQVLDALGISFEEIRGIKKMDSYF